MKIGIKEFMEHIFNPLHIYCRLIDCGLSSRTAKKVARIYELFIFKPTAFCIPAIKHQKQAK
ncbi:hypothetical protein SAMN05660337_1773 [Maridesulfovibrio ferrireducens]|uniref:Uncharacterized protein n=1 Tax=Maridesulfovibrio ferrireducens TaxID=246191 RepID=A0A1G9FZN7_9BACT|nr:hypothetical protein SAMN05660337_1773 [Maridesulfovibrio ferrireducens]